MQAEKKADSLPSSLDGLDKLGETILNGEADLEEIIHTASLHNKWFTKDNLHYALKAIAENFLNKKMLQQWLAKYRLPEHGHPKRIGIVIAGNIPLAGFHDLLCVLVTGNFALIRQSSRDTHLLPFLLRKLVEIEPAFSTGFEFTWQLQNFDAIIATGSDNSARYFEYYFGKYPHIIRKNRNSVGVLTGKETPEELFQFGNDIFLYFGLGCRSVSKLYVPQGYDFNYFFEALQPFQFLMLHNGYKNNYDFNLTINIMNKTNYFNSGFLILQENKSLSSPIATLNFEYYKSLDEVSRFIEMNKDKIQCVVGNSLEGSVPFGESQSPRLWDYADNADTIQFLIDLP